MNQEEWRDIEGYEGIYQVSNFGQVRGLDRIDCSGRSRKSSILKPGKQAPQNYLAVSLCDNRTIKHILIHRLVAQAFIPNPNNLPEINHKDENPMNNCVNNLEWCTPSYNINYGTGLERRASKRRRSIIGTNVETGEIILFSGMRQAERFGFNYGSIWSSINRHPKHKHTFYKGYIWKYADQED